MSIRINPGTQPLPQTGPLAAPAAPAAPTPAAPAAPGTAPLPQDQAVRTRAGGTSALTLPAGGSAPLPNAGAVSALAQLPGVASNVLAVGKEARTAHGVVDSALDIHSHGTKLVKAALGDKAALEAKGGASALGTGMTIAGGAAGAVGMAANAVSLAQGAKDLKEGHLGKGAVEVAQGALGEYSGAGAVARSVTAVASLAPEATSASKVLSAVTAFGETAGRVAPVLAVAGGALQVVDGAMKGDKEEMAIGGINAAAGVLMIAAPPVGTAIGGAVLAATAIYQNREAIGKAATSAWHGISHFFGGS